MAVGNTTLVYEYDCSHLLAVPDGRFEVQTCGGYYTTAGGDTKAIRNDLCTSSCSTKKQPNRRCPILCDVGALCDHELGAMQPSHCKGIVCSTNNTCTVFDTIPCSVHERSFHQFMTGVYLCLFVIGGLIYILQKNVCIPNKSWMADSNPSLWLFLAVIPGGYFAVVSGIFLGVCGTDGGTGWSVAGARATTIGWSLFLFYVYVFIWTKEYEGDDDVNSEGANKMAAFVWLMFFIADIMLSTINSQQNLFWVSETDIWPHLTSNERCGETENLYYVGWTTLMGFVSFFIICILNSVAADIDEEKASIYGKYVGSTSLLFMLINISFLGACKSNGKTIIYEYGLTICVFYGLILAFQLYTNMQVKKEQNRSVIQSSKSTPDIELSGVATGDVVVSEATPTPSSSASPAASGSKCCNNTRTIALLINFLIFVLNGWSGYVVHSQVYALKPTIIG
jgi:hypothetical protein